MKFKIKRSLGNRRGALRRKDNAMRKSGILMPVSSLPSKYGIGCFSKEAYEFVDFLRDAGQKYWQILPLGPTGYGDSPYQSFSTFAGNPYFIDLEAFIEKGWLTLEECEDADLGDKAEVDYEKIYFGRFPLLKKAFLRSRIREDKAFQEFCVKESSWLTDYSLYMAIKNENDGKSFYEWPEALRRRDKNALKEAQKRLEEEITFYHFLQYVFLEQWLALKNYANQNGVEMIGDIPIYVAADSADTWANPELFQLDPDGMPVGVAGCPPDYFSATGQLWGNPLYRWDYHKETGFAWWLERLGHCYRLYDMVRIDHFRGFEAYYSIPYGDPTAEFGHWEEGPGFALFDAFRKKYGKKPVIAEDLGFLTDGVRRLIRRTGYPGMKILEFAFDSKEDNDYLPHNYNNNCVVYTGTHDNDTVLGWIKTLSSADRKFVKEYLGVKGTKNLHWEMIRLALSSVADTAIIPMQDCLGLGSEGRINTPSTLGCNWKWRLDKNSDLTEIAAKLRHLSKIYGRF